MPASVRQDDLCSGHASWPPRKPTSWSPNVYVNGKPKVRIDDSWAVHCNPLNSCHAGTQTGGSPNVFVNGKAAARIGDNINCGSVCANGSPNVFINGG
jgi:uncharacterized Zn-binding protein involved in type VI secretion